MRELGCHGVVVSAHDQNFKNDYNIVKDGFGRAHVHYIS